LVDVRESLNIAKPIVNQGDTRHDQKAPPRRVPAKRDRTNSPISNILR
jgi:hypothetical protein